MFVLNFYGRMKTIKKIIMLTNKIVFIGLLSVLFFGFSANAQETSSSSPQEFSSTTFVNLENSTTTIDVNTTTLLNAPTAESLEPRVNTSSILDGIISEVPKEIPSGIGMFWRDIRERVSLLLTLDPVKKAEKHLVFAEIRIRIAEMIVEKASNNPKIQEKAEKMIERANEYIKKIEAKKEFFSNKNIERAEGLAKGIAVHALNKENVINKVEKRLKPEVASKLDRIREESASSSRKILQSLEKENFKIEVQEHIRAVKAYVEEQSNINEHFRNERKNLLEQAENGDSEARQKLKELNEQRQQQLNELRKERQETRPFRN